LSSDSTIGTIITVVTADKPRNKHYSRNADGSIEKTTPDFYGRKVGKTVYIQDIAHFKQVHDELGKHSNQFLIPSYVEGTVDRDEFEILSRADVSKRAGIQEADVKGIYEGELDFKSGKKTNYCARLKNTFTQSNILMFDRDEVDGMPEELIYPDIHSWWLKMQESYPMLKDVGYIVAKSNSGRILVDG
jgi:hypothetical protein